MSRKASYSSQHFQPQQFQEQLLQAEHQELQPNLQHQQPLNQSLEQHSEPSETHASGGYFEFDDGGWYAGDWISGKACGYGKCTGPQGKGEYSGTWANGFEVVGVYTWPNGHNYSGEWLEGKRSGLGIETKDGWVYKGEWLDGCKCKYGVKSNTGSGMKYEGEWVAGMQEGYGVETYVDESTYHGQWMKGKRHGFGVRKSVPKGISSNFIPSTFQKRLKSCNSLPSFHSSKQHSSCNSNSHLLYSSNPDNHKNSDSDKNKGGFVLSEDFKTTQRNNLQRSRSFSLSRTLTKRLKLMRSGSSNNLLKMSSVVDEGGLEGIADTGKGPLIVCSVDVGEACAVEVYSGGWQHDQRCGYGVSKRSDGLKYEGEWMNDKRSGYGVTTHRSGLRQEGRYVNNQLIATPDQKRRLFSKKKFQDRLDASVVFARKAGETAQHKHHMVLSKRSMAVAKASLAEEVAKKANNLGEIARRRAKELYIYYEDDNSIREEVVIEKPKSRMVGSMSSWSAACKSTIDNDDVFINSSKHLNDIPQHFNHHHPTLTHISQNFSEEYSHSSTTPQIPVQLSQEYNNKVPFRKQNISLDRHSSSKQYDSEVLNDITKSKTCRHHSRRKSPQRDYFTDSSMLFPDSLKPSSDRVIPSFQRNYSSDRVIPSFQHNNSLSSQLSLKSKNLQKSFKSNQIASFPKQPISFQSSSSSPAFSTNNSTLFPTNSQQSSPSCQLDQLENKARLRRRRYSNVRHPRLASDYKNDNGNISFQSIDMISLKKGSNIDDCNNNTSSQDSEVVQQPRHVFSIHQHTSSIRPNPYHISQSSNHHETSGVCKDIKSSVTENWIQDNLMVILIVLFNLFSAIYFVFFSKR